jgi:predicted ATPase/DNA-binding SARP family transcriptional activator
LIGYVQVVEFRILGSLEVRHAGGDVVISGAKQRLLLAALLVQAGEVVSGDRLIDILWGENLPANPRNALQIQVSQLRRRLSASGHDLLASRPPGYRMQVQPDEVDAGVFVRLVDRGRAALGTGDVALARKALEEALALWRGPALQEFSGHPFADTEIGRLEELRSAAQQALIEVRLRSGEHTVLISELERLVAQHPLREGLRGQLMVALYRSGRQAEALEVFHDTRRVLDEELGVDPTPELADLYERLLRHEDRAPPSTTARPAPDPPDPRRTLPLSRSSFVGREQELDRIVDLLRAGPLLTLVGPGGVGKTRLAVEAASRIAGAGGPTVWFVELATLADPALVPSAIAAVLGLRGAEATAEDGGVQARRRIAAALEARASLLVLDSCEHVVEAVAAFVEELLSGGVNATVLCTSREALGVSAEAVWSVPSLPWPDPDTPATPGELLRWDAVRLFVDRAASAQPGFALDTDTAPLVAEVCRRLDGIPLALELAAARVRLLGVRGLVERLDDRFRVLTAGARTAQPRQRTLQAVVDWSWDLLTEDEQRLFRRMAVFVGPCTLDAIERVCSDASLPRDQVLEVLGRLVGKSLVVAEVESTPACYRLLETLRAYGLRRLDEAGETDLLRGRHVDYLLVLAQEVTPRLRSRAQLEAERELDSRHDDIRAALRWLSDRGAIDQLGDLAQALGWFWYLGGHRREGVRWLAAARQTNRPRERATALVWHALLALDHQPVSALRPDLHAAGQVLRREGHDADRAFAGFVAALLATEEGDPEAAAHIAASRRAARAAGDDRALADLDLIEAMGLIQRGQLLEGAATIRSALDRLSTSGDRFGQVHAALMLAQLDAWSGGVERALAALHRGLGLASELHLRDLEALLETRLAGVLAEQADVTAAEQAVIRARSIAIRLSSERLAVHADQAAGVVAVVAGDLEAGRRLHRRVLEWFEAREQPVVAATQLHHLGVVAELDGDLDEALRLHLAGAARTGQATRLPLPPEMFTAPGPDRVLPFGLEGLAAALAAGGKVELAAALLGAAAARRPLGESRESTAARARAASREALGAPSYQTAFDRGRRTPVGELIAEAGGP